MNRELTWGEGSTWVGRGPEAGVDNSGSTDGAGTDAKFAGPFGMAAAAGSNVLFVSESEGNRIRKIDFSATPPQVSTLASGFNKPRGVSINGTTFLAVADSLNHAIRRVNTVTGVASTIAGTDPGAASSGDMDGIGTNARFNEPFDVAFANNDLLVADLTNKKLRLITGADYQVSTVSVFATGPRGVAVGPDGSFVLVACEDAIYKVTNFRSSALVNPLRLAGGTYGTADGNGLAAGFQKPSGLMLTPDGNSVLIAGVASHRVRELSLTGAVTTLLGGSPGYSDGYTQLVPSLWLMCGGEGATCVCDRQIRYGTSAGDRWILSQPRALDGVRMGLPCRADEFSSDPAPGSQKSCECSSPPISFQAPADLELITDALLIADSDNNVIRSRVLKCAECPEGTYNGALGRTACAFCPASKTSAPNSTSIGECVCTEGYTKSSSGDDCTMCAAGKYKELPGPQECIECPAGKFNPKVGATYGDRDCFLCRTTCDEGQFLTKCTSPQQDSVCTPFTGCKKGFKITRPGSLEADAECESCGETNKPLNSVFTTEGDCSWVCFDEVIYILYRISLFVFTVLF
eukprot:Tamp_03229.p1 GENE.Tamp_03229~~Tamp_03229.p1  ORF type:complete len:675 (+),score=28.49 Tamp_03229:302-2026(+)